MKLWILKPHDGLIYGNPYPPKTSPWYSIWDCSHGMIVRANTEEQARQIASDHHGDEGAHAWIDPKYSTCVELPAEGDPGLILLDFCNS